MPAQHTVIIGDCRKMKELKNNSVQLIIISPPYFDVRNYSTYDPSSFGHLESYLKEIRQVFKECYRVLGSGCHVCVNFRDILGSNEVIPLPAHLLLALRRAGFFYRKNLIWYESKPPANKKDSFFEHTFIFRKGRHGKRGVALQKSIKAQGLDGMHPNGSNNHSDAGPEAFSEQLTEALIRSYTFEGETILDPFLSSGAISKVASRINRNSVGYENNPYNLRLIRRKAGISENRLKVVFQGEGVLT